MNKSAGIRPGQIENGLKLMLRPTKVQPFPRFLAGLIRLKHPASPEKTNCYRQRILSLQLTARRGLSKFSGSHKTVYDKVLDLR
ncbi:hypothetical protein LF95_11345 [Thalassospira sp. TSL5-1]|nr:hypothetical protein LF95_11345 [Thalassospira sp. TSL5-1]